VTKSGAEVKQRAVELDGERVRYRVTGSGEPLVLVHGLGGSWRWWSPLFGPLSPRRRLHMVDLPSLRRFGRPKQLGEWLGRWLDAAELERVDVAGHSLGGLAAAELAAGQPQRIRRLVLVSPAGIPCNRRIVGRAGPLAGALYDIRDSLPMVALDALRAGPLSLAHGIALASSRDLRQELPGVRAPVLLVWGEGDYLVPHRLADEWQRALPASSLVLLSCGHVPMLEAPGELARSMLAFLDNQVADDSGDQVRPRVVEGVRLSGGDDESPVR
jgi:pimeloyl-ACP methyl ester carboxylesterase